MSIKTTTPVEDAAKLGGKDPGYYARAAKDWARMVSNGSVPVTTAMAVTSWQGKYTGNEAVIAIDGDRFDVKEAGLYLISLNTTLTANTTQSIRIMHNDNAVAGDAAAGQVAGCSCICLCAAGDRIGCLISAGVQTTLMPTSGVYIVKL